jgi:hypothetical protein
MSEQVRIRRPTGDGWVQHYSLMACGLPDEWIRDDAPKRRRERRRRRHRKKAAKNMIACARFTSGE